MRFKKDSRTSSAIRQIIWRGVYAALAFLAFVGIALALPYFLVEEIDERVAK